MRLRREPAADALEIGGLTLQTLHRSTDQPFATAFELAALMLRTLDLNP